MTKKTFTTILLVLTFNISCSSDNGSETTCGINENENVIVGCWKAALCYQLKDDQQIWLQPDYRFIGDGTVKYKENEYSDSSCESSTTLRNYQIYF